MRSQQEVLKEITTPESGKKRYRDSMAKLLVMRSPFAAEPAYEKRAKLRLEHPRSGRNLLEEFKRIETTETSTTSSEKSVTAGVRMRRV